MLELCCADASSGAAECLRVATGHGRGAGAGWSGAGAGRLGLGPGAGGRYGSGAVLLAVRVVQGWRGGTAGSSGAAGRCGAPARPRGEAGGRPGRPARFRFRKNLKILPPLPFTSSSSSTYTLTGEGNTVFPEPEPAAHLPARPGAAPRPRAGRLTSAGAAMALGTAAERPQLPGPPALARPTARPSK